MFCNRSLNMRTVTAVGFDMDYTMAQYRPETFEVLAYNLTVKQLVEKLGYPSVRAGAVPCRIPSARPARLKRWCRRSRLCESMR